jgi:hypothetical protein
MLLWQQGNLLPRLGYLLFLFYCNKMKSQFTDLQIAVRGVLQEGGDFGWKLSIFPFALNLGI